MPRCRFGSWYSSGATVHNTTHMTCDKPPFADTERYATGAYPVYFSPNGQCLPPTRWVYSIVPPHLNDTFLVSQWGQTSTTQPTVTPSNDTAYFRTYNSQVRRHRRAEDPSMHTHTYACARTTVHVSTVHPLTCTARVHGMRRSTRSSCRRRPSTPRWT